MSGSVAVKASTGTLANFKFLLQMKLNEWHVGRFLSLLARFETGWFPKIT